MNSFSGNDSSVLKTVGERIKDTRLSMNLTQSEFAETCGISESTIKRIESGEDTKFSNIIKILRHLNLLSNIDLLLPEKEPDYKALFENQKERKRASKKVKPSNERKWGDE